VSQNCYQTLLKSKWEIIKYENFILDFTKKITFEAIIEEFIDPQHCYHITFCSFHKPMDALFDRKSSDRILIFSVNRELWLKLEVDVDYRLIQSNVRFDIVDKYYYFDKHNRKNSNFKVSQIHLIVWCDSSWISVDLGIRKKFATILKIKINRNF
jgi:hypothetical protein